MDGRVNNAQSWPNDMVIDAYRTREDRLRERLAGIGECPFCGNSTRGEAEHGDNCELGPVEVCGKPIPDDIMGGTYPCRKRAVHEGVCDDL